MLCAFARNFVVKKPLWLLLFLALFLGHGPDLSADDPGPLFGSHPPEGASGAYLPGRIIFKLKPNMAGVAKSGAIVHPDFDRAVNDIRPQRTGRVFPHHQSPALKAHPTGEKMADLSLIYEMQVDDGQDVQAVISRLMQTGLFAYAEPRYLPHLLLEFDDEQPEVFMPNDSLLFTQYYLHNIRAFEAWAVSRADTNVFVAIVDTGNDFEHPDLVGSLWYNWADPINGEDTDNDGYVDNFYGWNLGEDNNYPQYRSHGHGVHVSGTSSATANNGIGIAGTGFHARYMPVKVDDVHGRLVMAYEGIVYAADQGAAVINCSWGSHFGGGQFGADIVRYAAVNRDALVVGGAGNAGNSLPFYPASYGHVLGVAGTDSLDHYWSQSSYGLFVGISAPSVRMLSTWTRNRYIRSSGTSMAAPIVAGAAALLRSHFPELTAMQTAARLQATADPIDTIAANQDRAGLMGAGRLNMYRALTDPFTPWLRLARQHTDEETYGAYRGGDTIVVAMDFQNLLGPAGQLTARLISFSPFVTVINDQSDLGAAATMETISNAHDPFIIHISEDTPLNHTMPFFVAFAEADTLRAGRQGFAVVVNKDYLTIDAGMIQTTITSKGAIGFNYPNYAQGVGMVANRGFTMIKCAGLLFGDRQDRVADNIYAASESPFSQTFTPVTNVARVANPRHADQETAGRFDSSGQDGQLAGIQVDHHSYFWETLPNNSFFITEYRLTNTTEQTPRILHKGFFVDWASRNSFDMRARFDADMNLAWANMPEGHYAGLQMLTSEPVNHYAFDNDGHNESIKINSGFQMADKYMAMTTPRMEAGSPRTENDVSSMLSTGLHMLGPGESLVMAIALHAAESPEALTVSARRATDTYSGIRFDSPVGMPAVGTDIVAHPKAWPNPFSGELTLQAHPTKSKTTTIAMYNMQGLLVEQTAIGHGTGMVTHRIQTAHLPPGAYVVVLAFDNQVFPVRVIKYE